MTLEEAQDLVDRNDFAITYLGRGHSRSRKKPYVCSLQPTMENRRWRSSEVVLRGTGESYTAALEDALGQLSHFLIERIDPP